MTIATRELDAAEYLDSEETRAEFLSAALETGNPAFIAESIDVIARVRGAGADCGRDRPPTDWLAGCV